MIICLAKCHTSGVINKLNLSTTGKAQRKVQVIASDFRILRLILHGNDKLRILRFFFFFYFLQMNGHSEFKYNIFDCNSFPNSLISARKQISIPLILIYRNDFFWIICFINRQWWVFKVLRFVRYICIYVLTLNLCSKMTLTTFKIVTCQNSKIT